MTGPSARALLAALLLAGGIGCGGDRGKTSSQESVSPIADPLQLAAARADSLFLAAHGSTDADSLRDRAFREIEDLLRRLALEAKPGSGWTLAAFRKAAGRYGQALRFESLGELQTPFLVLAHDPRNVEQTPHGWLFYADTGTSVRLPSEPFLQDFSPRAWRESGEGFFAVLGWERARAGLQPKAWLFRLPADPALPDWKERTLPAVSEQFLSQGGALAAHWLPATAASPRIRVEGAARPNPYFEECGACPHVEADLVYGVALEQFVRQEETLRRTPYAAFVSFVESMIEADGPAAMQLAANPMVVDVARQYGFDRPPVRGRWRAAPGVTASQLDQTYFRGDEGAFRVLLSVRDSSFVVTSITPTEYHID